MSGFDWLALVLGSVFLALGLWYAVHLLIKILSRF